MNNRRPAATLLRVTYLEQCTPARPPALQRGGERIARERMMSGAYLDLYLRVGESFGWDQRLTMPAEALAALLGGDSLHLYMLRDVAGDPLGFCEFDRDGFPDVQLTNFGLVPQARGRGLGPWLLATSLQAEWR